MSGESPGVLDGGRHSENRDHGGSEYEQEHGRANRSPQPRIWQGSAEFCPQLAVPHEHFTQSFLRSILTSIESKDQAVANAWFETLLDVFELIPASVLQNEILDLALRKAQPTTPVDSRMAAARLIGKLAGRFDSMMIQAELIPMVQCLSQDVCPAVRACISRQIQPVAKGLGAEAAKSNLLAGLMELANDDDLEVKLAALETFIVLTPFLDVETVRDTIYPLMLKMCERAMRVQDDSLNFLAQHFGKMCHNFSGCVRPDDKAPLIEFYVQMSRLGLSSFRSDNAGGGKSPMPDLVPVFANQTRLLDCRLHCAFNLPAMVLFAHIDDLFSMRMEETLGLLASDPHRAVRYTVACGIHEVCLVLGSGNQMLWTHFIQLLRDNSVEVIQAVVPNLSTAIQAITRSVGGSNTVEIDAEKADEAVIANAEELANALLQCEATITSKPESGCNWRLHSLFLRTVALLPQHLPKDRVYKMFAPLLWQRMVKDRPVPCRESAAYSLLVFLRNNRKREERQEILDKLNEEFCRGQSYHRRMLYLKISEMAAALFSKSYFKNYFFRKTLAMIEDKVVNVRIRACRLLPVLKSTLELPRDKVLISEMDDTVARIAGKESDQDVLESLHSSVAVMEDIPIGVVEEDGINFDSDTEVDEKRREGSERSGAEFGIDGGDHRDSRSPETSSTTGSAVNDSRSSGGHNSSSVGGSATMTTTVNLTVGDSPTNNQAPVSLPNVGATATAQSPGSGLPKPAAWNGRMNGSSGEAGGFRRGQQQQQQQQQQQPQQQAPVKSRTRATLLSFEASQRLENLDPSTDEFLVDAGVRMSPAAWKPLRQPPPPSILPLSALNNRLARSSALEALNAQQRPEGNLRRRQGFGMYFWDSEAAGSSPKSSSSSLRSSNAAKQMQLQDKQGGKKLPPTSVSDTNTKLTRMSTMPELAVQRRPPGIIAQKSVPTDVSRRKSAGTIGVAKPSKLRPPSSRMSFSGVASSPNTSSAESSPISSRSSSPGTTNDVVVTTPFARATAHRASLGAMRGLRQGVSPAGGGAAGIRARKQPSSANSSPTMSRASAAKLQDVGMGVQKRRSGGAVVATSSGSGYASSRLPQPRMLKEHTGGPVKPN